MIIEPGVYRDKPSGAILLILGNTRLTHDEDGNFLDLVDLVVLSPGDAPFEWQREGVPMQATEEVFDDSKRVAGKIVRGTCLERVV